MYAEHYIQLAEIHVLPDRLSFKTPWAEMFEQGKTTLAKLIFRIRPHIS